jgi:chemotaxis protein MotB
MSAQINAKAHGSRGKMVRITGRITSCATLALLLVANASPGSAQGTKMSDVANQLRTALAGESVTVTQEGPVTLTSSADSMFPSAGWELNAGAPLLAKIVPMLAKFQHTEIVVGGYTDNATVGPTLQSAGVSTNLDLSCKRAASVVVYLVSKGVKPSLLSAQCFGDTHPVAPNDTAEGKAKNRRVDITLAGDGT